MKVTLIVPTVNEIDGMRAIMPRVKKEWCDQIIVVDKGSTDGTLEYAREQGYEVYHQKSIGLGNSYRDIYPYIKGDIVITFSPDGNSIPELIPDLVAKIKEGYDLVIASRYLGGAKSDDDTFMSGLGNAFFTKLISLCFGQSYTDSLVIYRAYRKDIIKQLGLMHDRRGSAGALIKQFYSWETLTSIRAAKKKLRVTSIPGPEPARIGGESKCMHYRNAVFIVGVIAEELIFWDVKPDA